MPASLSKEWYVRRAISMETSFSAGSVCLLGQIMSSTCATELMTKFHEGHHIVMGLNLFEWQFMLLEPSSGL